MFQQWFSEDNRKQSHSNNNNISISCDMASLRNCILFCCIYKTVSFSFHNKSFAQKSFAIISLKTKFEKCHSFTKIQLKCFAQVSFMTTPIYHFIRLPNYYGFYWLFSYSKNDTLLSYILYDIHLKNAIVSIKLNKFKIISNAELHLLSVNKIFVS